MKLFYLFLAALATFRLALMISSEDGPARMFKRVRNLPPPKSNARDGLSCEWCMSVWISAIFTSYLSILDVYPMKEWPIWWLGISAGAVILNQQFVAKVK